MFDAKGNRGGRSEVRKRAAVVALCLAAPVVLAAPFASADPGKGGEARYLYNLAGFNGTIPLDGVKVAIDEPTGEVYVPHENGVTVFNRSGMEEFRFGDDERLGRIVDVGVLGDGTILLLSYFSGADPTELTARLVRCDYRGEPTGTFELTGLPEGFQGFRPDRMAVKNDLLYLVSDNAMTAVVANRAGEVQKALELWKTAGFEEREVGDQGLGGFAVGADGAIVYSLPVVARVVRIAPDGKVDAFGKRGSGPGKFGVPKGVGVDGRGAMYVVDILRRKVLVFDAGLSFDREFGSLSAPQEIAVTASGTAYVSQRARRGVSVYQVGQTGVN